MNSPNPMRECRPGGTCRECNAPDPVCHWCGDATVENEGDQCDACAALEAEKASEVIPATLVIFECPRCHSRAEGERNSRQFCYCPKGRQPARMREVTR